MFTYIVVAFKPYYSTSIIDDLLTYGKLCSVWSIFRWSSLAQLVKTCGPLILVGFIRRKNMVNT